MLQKRELRKTAHSVTRDAHQRDAETRDTPPETTIDMMLALSTSIG